MNDYECIALLNLKTDCIIGSLSSSRFILSSSDDQLLSIMASSPIVSEKGLYIYAKEVDATMALVAYRPDGSYIFYRNADKPPMRVAHYPITEINNNVQAFLYAYESTFTTLILDQGNKYVFAPYARFEDASIIGTVYGILDFCLTRLSDVLNLGTYDMLRLTVMGTSPDHEKTLRTIIYSVVQALMEFSAHKENPIRKVFLSRIDMQVGDTPLACHLQGICDELLSPSLLIGQ